jgi:hypothetical protein
VMHIYHPSMTLAHGMDLSYAAVRPHQCLPALSICAKQCLMSLQAGVCIIGPT